MQFFLKIVRSLIRKKRQLTQCIRQSHYRRQAVYDSWLHGGSITLPKNCNLAVPLCCNGSGKVSIGNNASLGFRLAPIMGSGQILLQARNQDAIITIGENASTSNNISMIACSKISIGEKSIIGDQVTIYDSDFHGIDPESRSAAHSKTSPVSIGNNVWIGSKVMILKGVTIGDHCVIAAGSIVTKSIPERSLAGGSPAQVIRML